MGIRSEEDVRSGGVEDLGGYAIWGVYDLGRGVNDPRGYKYWVYKI